MTKQMSRDIMLKSLIGVIVLLVIGLVAYPRILQNGSGGVYDEGRDSNKQSINPIELYIIEGAGYFLDAESEIKTILKLVELQEIQILDFNELVQSVDKALYNMNRAREIFMQLIQKAEITPYKESVITTLKSFDYSSFRQQNNLNTITFKEVESFLSKGDITGTYRNTYSKFINIINWLTLIKEKAELGKIPELQIFWRLNETCAETSQFGSYIARIFYAIL